VPLISVDLAAIGEFLAASLRSATGLPLPVRASDEAGTPGNIVLTQEGVDPALGDEGYELDIRPQGMLLRAARPAGIFRGVQTIRQLLPASAEQGEVQPDAWCLPCSQIRDLPRFAWRGMMLDVARHFFGVEDVKRLIDLMALYKLNIFHLHLSDDQGWRVMIRSWPELALKGGSLSVGGGPGGYYTREQYAEIVEFARQRYITVVPEIDMPGHVNAALASYPELNGDGKAPELYTGTEVGFSSLSLDQEVTYRFIEDVVAELAAMTPGDYIHIGGDEAFSTDPAGYAPFIERVQAIVQSHGKRMAGWEEISRAKLLPSSLAQAWRSPMVQDAVKQGARVIMSPASMTYLDMKYTASTPLGLAWAGMVDVKDAYDWDPATLIEGVGEKEVAGIEAPLWSETLRTMKDVEYMAFPRLIALAEVGWSSTAGRNWAEFAARLAQHSRRLEAMDVNFYRSTQVDWA
jgi:hexosaminidase